MNDLHKALGDISSIRKQVATATEFRGYGPATLAATSIFAILGACLQGILVPNPTSDIPAYLTIWIATAALSAALTGVQMYTRARRLHSTLSNEMLRMAVEQFLPAVGAGLLLTIVLLSYAPASAWMLPGLWQIIYCLGIFSSCRFLPKPMLAAGTWYLLTGLGCIAIASPRALSPLAMAMPFAIGQLLIATILLFNTPEAADEV